MAFTPHSAVRSVVAPPIAEVQSWVAGREFPADRPLLDVSQAVPSYAPAESLLQHLRERVGVATTHLYTDILGRGRLRQALADDINDAYKADIEARQVAITAGCNQAFCLCLDALAGPGDEVILPVPTYFNHQMWLELRGVQPKLLLPSSADLLPEPRAARALISSRTRAIVLVSPNNPTGAVYSPELLQEFFQLARENNLALIVDETYRDFRGHRKPPHDLWRNSGWDDTFIHLYSFSKAYALTGHRVGAIVACPKLLDQIAKIMDCAIICAPHLGQEAAIFALQHLQAWRDEKADLMRQRVQALRDCFQDHATSWELAASGAYFAYVKHPFVEDAQSVARRLADQANVLGLPGSVFGPRQESYLRFAFANLPAEQVPLLVDRLP